MSEPLLVGEEGLSAGVPWRRLLFASHLASAWGERMWEFSAGLLLLRLSGGKSLQLPALLGFVLLMVQALLGPLVGKRVDRGHALHTPVRFLAGQNWGIALAALCVWLTYRLSDNDHRKLGILGTLICSAAAKYYSIGSKLSVEKHWATALAPDSGELARLNGLMRRIDLSCKILAPLAAGLVIQGPWGHAGAAGMVAMFNVLAWPVEASSLRRVYQDPVCREKLEARFREKAEAAAQGSPSARQSGAWRLYFSQDRVWPSALALSLLHLTVLSFGQVMTAYVMTLNVGAGVVALYRGLGEVFGVTATFVCPPLVKKVGAARSATRFIWTQLFFLVPAAMGASSWAKGEVGGLAASMMLVCGVGISRLGLWGFDMSVSQLIQERVPQNVLGTVSGVQNSLEASFGASSSLLAVVFSDTSQFQYLAIGSWCSVCTAAVMHTISAARDNRAPCPSTSDN